MILSDDSLPADRESVAVWLLEQEERIAALCRAAIRGAVVAAFERFAKSITAAGDLNEIDTISDAWLTFTHTTLVDELGALHLAGSMTAWVGLPTQPSDAFAAAWAAVVNHNAESYMQQHLPQLVGVGQRTRDMVRRQAELAITKGWTNEELKGKIEDLTKFSEARADTIARTETIGAYVQGDMAGARALGDDGPVEKVWVATLDRRTRPSHHEADGQCVLLGESFTVGGVQMDAPHDPSGPAGEVVNCRCYVDMLYPGDMRPDGTTVEGPVVDKVTSTTANPDALSKPVSIPDPPTRAQLSTGRPGLPPPLTGRTRVVSAAEADRFAEGSSIPWEMHHGSKAAGSIRDNGFDLDLMGSNTNNGGMMGTGTYVTGRADLAVSYARNVEADLISTRVNVTNVVDMMSPEFEQINRVATDIADDFVFTKGVVPDYAKKLVEDAGGYDAIRAAIDSSKWPHSEATRLLAMGQGYDGAVSYIGDKALGARSIMELVVYEGKNLVVVV